jgi:hypothetical protein
MEFHPIKYKQPVIGDARCALYAMANLFDDRAFLLMNNVNEMTDHEEELLHLKNWHWAKQSLSFVEERWNMVNHLEFHAGIFNNGRIHLEDLNLEGTGSEEVFYAGLIDYRIPGKDYAHTVGFLWPEGEKLVVVDAQKNEPKKVPKEAYFKILEVVGFRLFSTGSDAGDFIGMMKFKAEAFPHIFNLKFREEQHTVQTCTNLQANAS